MTNDERREEIAKQIREYVRKGNSIKSVGYGVSGRDEIRNKEHYKAIFNPSIMFVGEKKWRRKINVLHFKLWEQLLNICA